MNSTIIDLGIIQIKWYSIFILIAIVVATTLVYLESKKKGLSKDDFIDMIFYGLIIGILGARVYYVLFNLDYYIANPLEIIYIWHGGLAIHGGLIAALIFLIFYTKKRKLKLLLLLDIIVVGLIIGQAIGRWGNFFNQEAFGREVTLDFLKSIHLPNFIINGMYIGGTYREPTFLYESICSFIGFIILLIVRNIKNLKTGVLTSLYLIWYGIVRLIIETYRSDSLMLGNIKIAQIISVVCIISGIVLIVKSKKNIHYREDKLTEEE